MIITIDGPVATGKSTIARKLAEALGYIYFDTGAMYRSLTYGILKHRINIENVEELEHFLKSFDLDIKMHKGEEKSYCYEGEDITLKIRTPEVTEMVSKISAIPSVRKKLVALQQELAEGVNAVFEGRDMGTVVFPNAGLKIFLTGSPEVRAKRRFDELLARFPELQKSLTLEKALEDINKRDAYDTSREASPLKKADDAFLIDTSHLTPEQIVVKILEYKDALKNRSIPKT
jgi:cytidylate kinase